MARFVPDTNTLRWVIISPHRALRADEDTKKKRKWRKKCPFCPGSPILAEDEVYRISAGGELWKVMVIKNRYPITDISEVIILSPDHKKDFDELSCEHIGYIFLAYRHRFQLHAQTGHVLIFHNFGDEAGASIDHPHSQLIVIPKQVILKSLGREPIFNLVSETENFIIYCPEFSQWPYEVWIAPRSWGLTFGEITDEEIAELVLVLKKTIVALKKLFSNLSYNFYIHFGRSWYLRISPRLVTKAGFELGTGIQVNIVDPKQAAAELKEVFAKIKI